MTTGRQGRILWHGTTRKRAEAILRDGPSLNFMEPGSRERADGFSAAPTTGPYPEGSPQIYALGKAKLFPDENGPAILEIEVPDEIIQLANDLKGEVRFTPGWGFEELLMAWPRLPKRIL